MIEYVRLVSGASTEELHETDSRALVSIDGLIGLVGGIRGEVFDRPEDDGAVEPENQYLPARIMTFEGEVWGAGTDACWQDFAALVQMFEAALRSAVTLEWAHAEATVELQGSVRLAGMSGPIISAGPTTTLSYQVQLRAADPRWYSQTESTEEVGPPETTGGFPIPIPFPIPFGSGGVGGSVSVANAGNSHTWPRIEVLGPINGPVIEHSTSGRALYFPDLNLAEGATLLVETNPAARSATVAGANVLGTLDQELSEFFALAPGPNTIAFYGLAGGYGDTTLLRVHWRDAFSVA